MRCRRYAPGGDRNRITDLRAETVHEPANTQQPEAIGELESRIDPAKLLIVPPDFLVEDLLEQRKNLAIDVIDRRRKKQQCADNPPVVADGYTADRLSLGRRGQLGGNRLLHGLLITAP